MHPVILLSFLPGDISLEWTVVLVNALKSLECNLIFEERKLLSSRRLTCLGKFCLALWTELSSAIGYQLWELVKPELKNTLHSLFLLLVPLLPSKKTLMSLGLLSSFLLFYKREAQNVSCLHEHKHCWGYLGCICLSFPHSHGLPGLAACWPGQ